MKKQHWAETTHKIFLALSSFFSIFCLKSNLKVCSFFLFHHKQSRTREARKKASNGKGSNSKWQTKMGSTYILFHFSCYAFIFGIYANMFIVAQVYTWKHTATPIPILTYSELRFHTNKACLHKHTFIHTYAQQQ